MALLDIKNINNVNILSNGNVKVDIEGEDDEDLHLRYF